MQTGEYGEDRGYGKNSNDMFSIYFCLKLKFSSNVTPRFKTEAAGMTQDLCREKDIELCTLR